MRFWQEAWTVGLEVWAMGLEVWTMGLEVWAARGAVADGICTHPYFSCDWERADVTRTAQKMAL